MKTPNYAQDARMQVFLIRSETKPKSVIGSCRVVGVLVDLEKVKDTKLIKKGVPFFSASQFHNRKLLHPPLLQKLTVCHCIFLYIVVTKTTVSLLCTSLDPPCPLGICYWQAHVELPLPWLTYVVVFQTLLNDHGVESFRQQYLWKYVL